MKKKPKKRKKPVFATAYPSRSKAQTEVNSSSHVLIIEKSVPDPPPVIVVERAIPPDKNGYHWMPSGNDWVSFKNVTPSQAYEYSVWVSEAVGDLWLLNYGYGYRFPAPGNSFLILSPLGTPRQLQEHEVLHAVQRHRIENKTIKWLSLR